MKTTILGIVLAVLLTGCSTTGRVSPSAASFFAASAVSAALANSPQTANQLRQIQQAVCAVATRTNLTPEMLNEAIKSVPEAESSHALMFALMGIYLTSMGDTTGTNGPEVGPYAKAVWCDGFKAGLDSVSRRVTRSQSPPVWPEVWPMIR